MRGWRGLGASCLCGLWNGFWLLRTSAVVIARSCSTQDQCFVEDRVGECALGFVPFTRASSAGLTGKRVIGCLRLEEPSFMTPRQPEQRSEPEGPRSRVPRGIVKGGWASSPPLTRRKRRKAESTAARC